MATSTLLIVLASIPLLLSGCEVPPADSPQSDGEKATESETEVSVIAPPDDGSWQPPPEEPPSEDLSSPPSSPADPGVAATGEETRGKLAPQKIQSVLDAERQAFVACYEAALSKDPTLKGGITLVVVIAPDGRVPHAEVNSAASTLMSEAVAACMVQHAKTLQFDKPSGGKVVTQYALEFQPPEPSPE